MKNNNFVYETSNGKTKGFFNIYQGKNGKIYLMMGNNFAALTYAQINDLNIDVYNLKDFDYDLFNLAYNGHKSIIVTSANYEAVNQ